MENVTTTTTVGPTPAPVAPKNALKAILLMTLFFATFLASTASFVLKRFVLSPHDRHAHAIKRAFSLVSCFGAGVFVATCLLDLMPDSMDSIRRAEKRMGREIAFPLAEFCIAGGFLLVLFLEQAILYAHERQWLSGAGMERLLAREDSTGGGGASTLVASTASRRSRSRSHEENEEEGGGNYNAIAGESSSGDDGEAEADAHFEPETHSTFRVLLLVFALSLHAVFEGLSIGMVSEVPLLLQLFGALLIHKSVVGFSLGVRLVQSRLRPTTTVLCCALFASQALVGGFLGLAIVDLLNQRGAAVFMVSGILQAIACGTFLYVTAFEILPHELDDSHRSLIPVKMLCLILGFALITGFIAIFPEADND